MLKQIQQLSQIHRQAAQRGVPYRERGLDREPLQFIASATLWNRYEARPALTANASPALSTNTCERSPE